MTAAGEKTFCHAALQFQLAPHTLPNEVQAPPLLPLARGESLTLGQYSAFLARLRTGESPLVAVADSLMRTLALPANHPLRIAAVTLAARATQDEKAPYHNHHHTLDVLSSMWRLSTTNAEGLERNDVAVGVLSALAHDLGYDLSVPANQREEASLKLAESLTATFLPSEDWERLQAMVRGTAPVAYSHVKVAYQQLGAPDGDTGEQRAQRLTALLVRADLASSTAVNEPLNRQMSHLLAEEQGNTELASPAGRLAFVANHGPYTNAEEELGLDQSHVRVVCDLRALQEPEIAGLEAPDLRVPSRLSSNLAAAMTAAGIPEIS